MMIHPSMKSIFWQTTIQVNGGQAQQIFFAEYETCASPGDSSFAGLNLFHVKFSFCGLWSRLTMLFWKYFLSWTYLVKLKLMLLFQESFHSDNWTFWHWSSQKKYIADFLRWLHLIHGYYTCSLDCLSIFHAYFAQKICLQVFNSKLFRKFLLINLICYSSNTFKTCNEI